MVADSPTYRKMGTWRLDLNSMAWKCVQQDFFLETVPVIVLSLGNGGSGSILYFLDKSR